MNQIYEYNYTQRIRSIITTKHTIIRAEEFISQLILYYYFFFNCLYFSVVLCVSAHSIRCSVRNFFDLRARRLLHIGSFFFATEPSVARCPHLGAIPCATRGRGEAPPKTIHSAPQLSKANSAVPDRSQGFFLVSGYGCPDSWWSSALIEQTSWLTMSPLCDGLLTVLGWGSSPSLSCGCVGLPVGGPQWLSCRIDHDQAF